MPKTPLGIGLLIALIGLTALGPAGGHASPPAVLILPFNLYAPPDLAYLGEGIMATLSSRFQPFASPIVPTPAMRKALEDLSAPYNSETAQTVGVSLGATHAVTGSVTIVGDAVSTDIQLWRLPEGTALSIYHADGNRPDAVLAHLDAFILQVEKEVFSSPSTKGPSLSTPAAAVPPPGPPPVTWQSQHLDAHILGLAMADLTPAPGMEMALIDEKDLWICKREGKSLRRMTKIEGAPYLRLIAVDAADINGNGTAEIFVSAYHLRLGQPRSLVVEWDATEKRFAKNVENLPTYLRVTGVSATEKRLVGQKQGGATFFGALPVQMQWQVGQYAAGDPLNLPPETNLYEFVRGPFLPGGTDAVFTLTPKKELELYAPPDTKRWRSDTAYGGSSVYLDESETPQNRAKQLKGVGEETIKRYYLHPRMVMQDLDGDGAGELLVVHNMDTTKGLFRRARRFNGGRVVCLTWQELGPVAKWETPKVSGHITDMAIVDDMGAGRPELIYTVVAQAKTGLDRHRSHLVAHELRLFK